MRNSIYIAGVVMIATVATALHSQSDEVSEESPTISAQAVRSAILGRSQYIPSEQRQLVIDRCSLLRLLRPAQVDTVMAEVAHSATFTGCGSDSGVQASSVLWKLRDAMVWTRTTMLAVEISKQAGMTVQRERYTIEDDAFLSELVLSHYGVFD